ncbi:squalene--hopene cyclase [Dyella caseinilytica]|uniref:Squalene--hopene cyclase n=1 Tax=Dyella caseinilytica TaxID=1849581 RepID=A0ABX7GSF9_9GAMM|nr:squalene--hopene cyclase [Dyella caseinilytica]QRN53234.1 squalene--hopene cyclase [Dyella caseinilytica]GGA12496.1 Squalene--hopene cyclase [Dyella caseinilytica]
MSSSTRFSTRATANDAFQSAETNGLDQAIERGRAALLSRQHQDGHWCFELESDCTITAEYILMMHFMDDIDDVLQEKMARYLRDTQVKNTHGGWSQYYEGDIDLSCTVKAYFALKAAGDDPEAEHMRMARKAILALGGAAHANVFTRILLALFEQVPWRATPYVPVEIMLLPRWFPFHIEKMSYWARTTTVPLTILCSLKAKAANPRKINVRELFVTPPEQEHNYFIRGGLLNRTFLMLDKIGRFIDPFIPKKLRQRAIDKAVAWFLPRMNGEDGIGAIFPPMVNCLEVMKALGYPKDHPVRQTCLRSIQKLVVHRADGSAYCQPCVSPIWDTVWSALTLMHTSEDAGTQDAIAKASDWLTSKQELEVKGDWIAQAPDLAPGGWAFQYNNAYYPDIDDTAVVAALLHIQDRRRGESGRHRVNINRAVDWMIGLQSKNGGFAAFDANNTHYHLNAIPFADHGALLDPPTEDVSGRVVACLGVLARPQDQESLRRAVDYLRSTQLEDGSWWGRWGSNYIYGTWSVLAGLALAGEDPRQPYIRKAIEWLRSRQHADGGWGETNNSYIDAALRGTNHGISTPQTTAWALLAQLAFGDVHSDSVKRGIAFLVADQQASGALEGLWYHPSHNAPGFPRVYYLKYHGYTAYFPLWALSRYRQLLQSAAA